MILGIGGFFFAGILNSTQVKGKLVHASLMIPKNWRVVSVDDSTILEEHSYTKLIWSLYLRKEDNGKIIEKAAFSESMNLHVIPVNKLPPDLREQSVDTLLDNINTMDEKFMNDYFNYSGPDAIKVLKKGKMRFHATSWMTITQTKQMSDAVPLFIFKYYMLKTKKYLYVTCAFSSQQHFMQAEQVYDKIINSLRPE
jgi:hypothetical protein